MLRGMLLAVHASGRAQRQNSEEKLLEHRYRIFLNYAPHDRYAGPPISEKGIKKGRLY